MGELLLYYTLGSDPALWPAGERRERGLIMHDKGYYHSYFGANAEREPFGHTGLLAAAEGRCHPQSRSEA